MTSGSSSSDGGGAYRSDCAFAMGAGHAVCEDYAVTSSVANATFAILCDGCSSAPDTDIGARLLAHAAKQELRRINGLPENEDWITRAVRRASRQRRLLGLCPSSLDATLLGIVAAPAEQRFAAFTCGDGVVALGRRDGTLEIHSIRYEGGYPDYPNYRTDGARQAAFCALAGNDRVVETLALPPFSIMAEGEGEVRAAALYRFAAALSDGVHSFQSENRAVPYQEVVGELLAFKGFEGAFVRRRMQRFLKDAAARGWRHHDDLSAAVVYFGE